MKQIRMGSVLMLLLLGAGASALAVPQSAQEKGGAFVRADTDTNGQLSATEWSALFETLDANGDGELAPDELPLRPHRPFLAEPPDELLAHLIARGADEDDDGVVSGSEWAARVQAIDKNGDTTLEVDELPGPPQARMGGGLAKLIGRWDADQDGRLDADELATLFSKADRDQDGALTPSDGWPVPPAP